MKRGVIESQRLSGDHKVSNSELWAICCNHIMNHSQENMLGSRFNYSFHAWGISQNNSGSICSKNILYLRPCQKSGHLKPNLCKIHKSSFHRLLELRDLQAEELDNDTNTGTAILIRSITLSPLNKALGKTNLPASRTLFLTPSHN